MRDKLPCLPLIMERHCNAVKSMGVDYKYPEVDMYMFPQMWGSTALGFGGIGGQAMTTASTVIVEDYQNGYYSVFFGDHIAYLIENPNQTFFEDMSKQQMKPVSKSRAYRRDDTGKT